MCKLDKKNLQLGNWGFARGNLLMYNTVAVLHGDLADLSTRTLMRGAEPAVRPLWAWYKIQMSLIIETGMA